MPVMAFLAIDNPRQLDREQWVRLGLATTLHPDEALPVNDPAVQEFEARFCQDRFWTDSERGPNTRFMCTGNTLTVVGDAASAFFIDHERGVLAQFRHQYFLVGVVPDQILNWINFRIPRHENTAGGSAELVVDRHVDLLAHGFEDAEQPCSFVGIRVFALT